mmetsp:Transcript_10581/g.13406  ORF Transcript_10581/g.13406 Transcript_10581/m.13406 type:complete len:97 (+) Transcript_10581:168-458(+)
MNGYLIVYGVGRSPLGFVGFTTFVHSDIHRCNRIITTKSKDGTVVRRWNCSPNLMAVASWLKGVKNKVRGKSRYFDFFLVTASIFVSFFSLFINSF